MHATLMAEWTLHRSVDHLGKLRRLCSAAVWMTAAATPPGKNIKA
jgi:hypothetical protein